MNWAEAVDRAKQQDAAAWDELYTNTRREAYFVALKVCGKEQDAEDLVQEAYLTAFEKLPQLQEAENFPSWLHMIVANKCRDYLKKPPCFPNCSETMRLRRIGRMTGRRTCRT